MSVPNQTPYIIYNANGLTTVFPFEFYIINANDIQVSLNGETITSGYSVSGVGNIDGGDVIFLTPPVSGTVVMLERVVPTYRLTDYQDNGDLLADTVNKDFDRLWMAIQRAFIYLGLALRRPLFGGPFNAEGYRIANLGDPVSPQDAATKNYVDNVALSRVLRVTDSQIPPLPGVAFRANKIVGMDYAGRPVMLLPESGSAADVLLELAKPTGTNNINGTKNPDGAVTRNLTDTLSDYMTLQDFGGVDDFNGVTGTNNLVAFRKYFTYLNSIGGGCLNLIKTKDGTGKYFINGDDSTEVTSPVRIVADDGVSLHIIYSGGSENSPLVNTNLTSNRQIKIHYVNFGFTSFIGENVQKQLGDILPTVNNGDGIVSYPLSLSGVSDFKIIKLANPGTVIAPVSSAADSILYTGGGNETVAISPVSAGDEINALVSSPSSGVFLAGVITALGYAYLAQDSGTQAVKFVDGTLGQAAVVQGVPYALLDQQRDNFNNALLTVKVTSARTFSVLVNGLSVFSYKARSNILSACFGTENVNDTVSVSQMSKITGNTSTGAKALKILVCGDSISDTRVQYSHVKYLQMMLGSAGISVAEINNLAVSGETAAQQYARLQTVGAGYDLCLIQVGVNDVQAQTPFANFVNTIKGMVSYAKSIGAQPIVGIPTAFYSKAEANANGQSGGQDTQHNDSLHTYRALLIRAVADAGGLLNEETIKAYGAMTAKWLSLAPYSVSDRIVVDNIHPSPYGSMMLAQGWARNIIGWLSRPDTTRNEDFEIIPEAWLKNNFGVASRPLMRGSTMRGVLSLTSSVNPDGALAMTLPPAIKIAENKMFPVTAIGSSGNPVGLCNFYVGTNNNCYVFNIPANAVSVSCEGISF